MGRSKGFLVAVLALLAAAAGCAPNVPDQAGLPVLGVRTAFGPQNLCGLGISPAIGLANVPRGVARFDVRMTNLDVLFQTPWQASVPATGNEIRQGAATPFPAPCPGEQQLFTMRFEVLARDANGRALAYGNTVVAAQSAERTIRAMRQSEREGTPYGARPVVPAMPPTPAGPVGPLAPADDPFRDSEYEELLGPPIVPTY